MTENDFYNLSFEDMVDCLFRLKAKHHLTGLSKAKIIDLANLFKSGYRVNKLQPYITAISNREQQEEDTASGLMYYKAREWLEECDLYHRWLWEESQKIIDSHKKKDGETNGLDT